MSGLPDYPQVPNGGHVVSEGEDADPPDPPSSDIHETLKRLRIREVYRHRRNATNKRSAKAADDYVYRVFLETSRYLRYVFWTWYGLAATTLVGGLGPFDWFTVFFYALGGSIVLFLVLVGCLILNSPILEYTYWRWSNDYAGGLGLVNFANPNLFQAMTEDQLRAAKRFLSRRWNPRTDTETSRRFNLDGAKLLLQFASIVYEHPNQAVRRAVLQAQAIEDGTLTDQSIPEEDDDFNNLSSENQRRFRDALLISDQSTTRGDGVIREFANRIGVDFEPLSELGTTSSAFVGLFWDPSSNWIAVTFKGTQPIEFGEWLSDLSAQMTYVGTHIPGFRKVHLGFKERVFPEDCSKYGGLRPYDTISKGVQALALWLYRRNPERGKVNIWVTGHSLGCATASLVYSRFLMKEQEMGLHTSNLRDAYLFAAPIVSDRETVEVFNSKMFEDPEKPRTMWRVTSNGDFVATCLPELGDYNSISVSSNNGFAFAHLGTELRLRHGYLRATATGNHLAYGTRIHIESRFSDRELETQRETYRSRRGVNEWWRRTTARWQQEIPILGRFAAHGCVNYWDQLDDLDTSKPAVWAWN